LICSLQQQSQVEQCVAEVSRDLHRLSQAYDGGEIALSFNVSHTTISRLKPPAIVA